MNSWSLLVISALATPTSATTYTPNGNVVVVPYVWVS